MRKRRFAFPARLPRAALCLCLAAVLSAIMLPLSAFAAEQDTGAQTIVSAWAAEEIAQARGMNLISQHFGTQYFDSTDGADRAVMDYTAPITRKDMFTLAINYIELQNHFDGDRRIFGGMVEHYKYEKDDFNMPINPFADERDFANAVDSYTAYYLGIALGDENRAFNGNDLLTRQEAAAILLRAYQTCGGELPSETAEITFADSADIPDWARAGACALSAWGVMKGDDNGNFNPEGLCTYEQAIAMFLRLYNEAPVSRVKGNVEPIFTYEQCMEYLDNRPNSGWQVTAKGEGNGVTFVRWDLGGVMHPVATMIFVFRDGGMRMISGLDYAASVENAQFSQDGKTFSCTIIESGGSARRLTVDIDTMTYETVEIAAHLVLQ